MWTCFRLFLCFCVFLLLLWSHVDSIFIFLFSHMKIKFVVKFYNGKLSFVHSICWWWLIVADFFFLFSFFSLILNWKTSKFISILEKPTLKIDRRFIYFLFIISQLVNAKERKKIYEKRESSPLPICFVSIFFFFSFLHFG